MVSKKLGVEKEVRVLKEKKMKKTRIGKASSSAGVEVATRELDKSNFMILSKEEAQGIVDSILELPMRFGQTLSPILTTFQKARTLKQFEDANGIKSK